jgi:hypothetical protein
MQRGRLVCGPGMRAAAAPAGQRFAPERGAGAWAALRLFPRPALCAHAWKVLNALLSCRTPLLGAHRYHCADCGKDHLVPHSCRNRHCPGCQAAQSRMTGFSSRCSCLLPVHYFHVVFTLPHGLNALIAQNRRVLHTLLFECASATLLEFGQNKFKTRLGITAVLHTWSQTLMDHHHLHCIVTGGGLSADGSQWRGVRSGYLFPIGPCPKCSARSIATACSGSLRGKLQFHGQLAALAQVPAFQRLKREVLRKKWVVYAKRPFAGPEQVLRYLSRYTHRVAIGNGGS